MESYGIFTMNRERLIGRIYGRVLRVSLMFCYDCHGVVPDMGCG
jgi:hypothetical protein